MGGDLPSRAAALPESAHPLKALNLSTQSTEHRLALANAALTLAHDAIFVIDHSGAIVGANGAALMLTGYAVDALTTLTEQTLFDHAGSTARTLVTAYGQRMWVQVREIAVHDDASGTNHRVLILTDATRTALLAERTRFLEHDDPLSELPTKVMLKDHFAVVRAAASTRDRRLALLFINIDRFKSINDTFGRSAGDEFLRHAAEVIGEAIRESDALARIGGDEFIAIISGIESVAEVSQVIDRIRTAFNTPHLINGEPVSCTVSVGVSLFPDDGHEFDDLVHKADRAMDHARRGGTNAVLFHTEQMNQDRHHRRLIERDLRGAIARDEIFMCYQPQVDMESGRIFGLEALVRWSRPGFGLVPPNDFIPIAEESGLIVELGQAIYRIVCQQARLWNDAGIAVPVSVNLSPVEIARGEVDTHILEIVEEAGIPPELLAIEITEGGLVDDTMRTQTIIANLRESGVGLSIDDFLTGYSNFSYIRQFNATHLKIDRSFVSGIHLRDEHEAIVRAAIQMASALGVDTIAEGVETPEEAEMLRALGCTLGQGYLFARPLPADEIENHLVTGYCRPLPHHTA